MPFRLVYVWVLSQCSSGVDYDRSKIVFATAGLAARWYASKGYYMWHNYGGVLFDEIDQMAMDPEYATLWESARQEATRRKLLVSWSADILLSLKNRFVLSNTIEQSSSYGGLTIIFPCIL